ncbi:MAG: alpha-amylase family glycosyl hydrolase [Defluviitaleaceae bacterium]|nr:alpha-amylase family glycosyl hydrolase [Defluviitaleaceae bacterium]
MNCEYRAGDYVLEFDNNTGRWVSLAYKGKQILSGGNMLSNVALKIDGVTTLTRTQYHMHNVFDSTSIAQDLKPVSIAGGESSFIIELEGTGWKVIEKFSYNVAADRLERRFTITNNTKKTALLRNITIRTPVMADMNNGIIEMPGYPDILGLKCTKIPMGRYEALPLTAETQEPSWRPGLLGAVLPHVHMSAWAFAELPTFWQILKGDKGVWFEHLWECPARLHEGEALELGTQYFKCGTEEFKESLGSMHDFWDEVGVVTNTPTPTWAKEATIYEVLIGAKHFHRSGKTYSPYPEVENLIADLERIHEIGFDTLQIMPRFPFPNYSVHDYFDIDTHYGPIQSMRELVRRAHSLGMKVLLDIVLHGVSDKALNKNAIHERHPLLDEHPEFFIYTEAGHVGATYTWGFDQYNQKFREYMAEVVCFYINELDVDGFRLDAIHWNFFPNWKEDIGYPAYKTLTGSFGMFENARKAMLKLKPNAIFYTETPGPLMANACNLFYNYDEVFLYENLLLVKVDDHTSPQYRKRMTPLTAQEVARWLDLRKKVMPRGVTKVLHADSHDSHEWSWIGMFRREYFGMRETLALFAYCCFVEGAVMNFVGGEDGFEEEYKRLIEARKKYKPLLSGTCDYLAISSDCPSLFTPMRSYKKEVVIPVINFSDRTVESELDISAVALDCTVYEIFSGVKQHTSTGRIRLSLEPYGYQAWEVITNNH